MAVDRIDAPQSTHSLDPLAPDELQALQDSLVEITGLAISLETADGQPLMSNPFLPPVCRLLRQVACRGPELPCTFSSTYWQRQLAESEGALISSCPLTGLQIAAVPLRARGRVLATWVCGRVLRALPGDDWLRERAARLRVPEGQLRSALQTMAVVDEGRFRTLIGHIEVAARTLSSLAEARLLAREASREIQVTRRRLGALGSIGASVIRSPSLPESLNEALQTILEVLQLDSGAVFLRDEQGGTSRLVTHWGMGPDSIALAGNGLLPAPTSWDTLQGSYEPWVVPNVAEEPGLPAGYLRQLHIGAFVAAPLRAAGGALGMLTVHANRPRSFQPDEIALVVSAGEQLGLGVQGLRLLASEKQRAGELEALQQFNERILHTMQEGILIVDGQGRITYGTPRLAELTGYAIEELLGRDWASLAQPQAHPVLQQILQPSGQGHNVRHEIELVRKDGRIRQVSLGAVPLLEAGEPAGLLCVVTDLTEEVLLRRRLQQVEKLSAIGKLVAGVAHELNNPLTVIRGYAQLLRGRDDLGPAGRELGAISEHAERAARIVQELLTFAREHPPAREVVDLNAVLQSVLDMRERQMATSEIRVRCELAAGLPKLQGDPYQLQQVFLNILLNAEEAMAEAGRGGEVVVRTSALADGTVLATIRDNGPGIPSEIADRIFDPFFTSKADRQGTGLGLSICYGTVNAHGGRIWAESSPGQGTTLSVVLPVPASQEVSAPAVPEVVELPAPPPKPAAGKQILILEDEVEIARVVSRFLEREGYAVTVANEAQAALQAIERESFDLILTDLKMPGMSGKEFYAHLCDNQPQLAGRVAFVTGDTVGHDTRSFLNQTGRPYLAKPFSLDEMHDLVVRVLG